MKIEGNWVHFGPVTYDTENQNESRADYGARISCLTGDWGENHLSTDVTDALANVVHYLHRVGLDPEVTFGNALRSAQGDLEDEPKAKLDFTIALAHNRGADWLGQRVV